MIVVISGGQDSATCLLWALNRSKDVQAISFDYGQRHRIELECAKDLCKKLGVPHRVIEVSSLAQVTSNALVDPSVELDNDGGLDGLPSSFVAGRNLVFLTLAASFAVSKGQVRIVTGVCETDYSGYPDCRLETIQALEKAVSLGVGREIKIDTPLMHLSKSETWDLAKKEGEALGVDGVQTIVELTHTCYEGNHEDLHSWGYGCGTCPSCEIRKKGFEEFSK
jgi:7-cyano-7-deazaguanine synthase